MADLIVISHASFMAINRHIYQRLHNDNFTVEIIAPQQLQFPTGLKQAEPQQEKDPEIHFLELIGNNPRTYSYKNLFPLLDERKPKAILLDNDPVSFLAGTVGKWCKKNNAKLFCISCENLSLSIADNLKRRGIKNLPNIITKRYLIAQNKKNIDGVLCLNNDGVQIFKKEGFKNVNWMPLGFDMEVFYPNETARNKIRTQLKLEHFTLAYFGRIIPEKGVHIIIKALEKIKDLNWHLLLDSFEEYETPYMHEIKELISQCGLGDKIIFFNADHYAIADYMNAADVVLVPSVTSIIWKEQYGRVSAEAMACGKIVVASDSGALPDMLNGMGIIFEEGNIEALAKELQSLVLHKKENLPSAEKIAAYAVERLSIINQEKVIREKALESTSN